VRKDGGSDLRKGRVKGKKDTTSLPAPRIYPLGRGDAIDTNVSQPESEATGELSAGRGGEN